MKPMPSTPAADLRQRAEARLKELPPEAVVAHTLADTEHLVQQMRLHQLELELQNEELQRTRNGLEAERQRYRDLYEFAPVGYLTLDRDGVLLELNLPAARLLGAERDRLLRQRFAGCVCEGDRPAFHHMLERVFAGGGRETLELTLCRAGPPAMEARLEALRGADGQECRVAVLDITELKRADRDRLVLAKLESTGVLAAGLAHDFNNLLTVILLNLELARNYSEPDSDLVLWLEEALKASFQARWLTQQLIGFAGGGMSVRRPITLPPLLREASRLALDGSAVEHEACFPDELWSVEGDAGQLAQAVRSLVQNAREAMPQGGLVTLRAANVTLADGNPAGLPAGDYVRVRVTDHGEGIAPAVLPRIFDPYFSTKQRGAQKGMGLGLTLCHAIIQRHGGTLGVETAVGSGSTFQFFLPALRLPGLPAAVLAPAPSGRRGHLLVMDDKQPVRETLGVLLQRLGHTVELAADGEQALALYRQARTEGRPFDVVLLDLTVRAGMGGKRAVRQLLELDPAAVVVVMSGYVEDPVLRDYRRHGFRGALAKPFNSTSLAELLAQLLPADPA